MTKKRAETKRERKRYSVEFKQRALLRAVEGGVPAVRAIRGARNL